MSPEKRCNQCKNLRPARDFTRNRSTPDGLAYQCGPCKRAMAHDHYRRKRDQILPKKRAYSRKRASYDKARLSETAEGRARVLLRAAVARGELTKPDVCESCGKQLPPRLLHGHHHDYSKPLEVEWLCASCHGQRHRKDGR